MKLIRKFEIFLLKCHRYFLRKPKLSALILITVTLFSFFGLKYIRFILSVEDMGLDSVNSVQAYNQMRAEFDNSYGSTLIVSRKPGSLPLTDTQIKNLKNWFAKERNKHPEATFSLSTFDGALPISNSKQHLDFEKLYSGSFANRAATENFLSQGPWTLYKRQSVQPIFIFQLNFQPSSNFRFGSFDASVLKKFKLNAEKMISDIDPQLQLWWIGEGDYQFYVQAGLERAKTLNGVMVLLLILLLNIIFKSWKPGLIFGMTLIVAGIWMYGLKGWLDSPFDVLSNSLFLMLGVSTLQDFVFIAHEQKRGASMRKSVRTMVIPSFYTSLTTVLGFYSLNTSSFEMIRRLGTWAAVGALMEWLIIFLFLPSICLGLFGNVQWVGKSKTWRLFKYLGERKISFQGSKLALIVFPISLSLMTTLKIQDSPEDLFPPKHSYQNALNFLSENFGWRGVSYLVFEPKISQEVKQDILKKLKSAEFKTSVASIESFHIIKSYLTQSLDSDLQQIVARLYRRTKSAQSYFSANEEKERWILYLKQTGTSFNLSLIQKVSQLCTQNSMKICQLAGKHQGYAEFASEISSTLYESLAVSIILVSLVLWILASYKGKARYIGSIISSSMWGPACMLIVMSLFEIPVNFLTSVFLCVLVGLTGDNAIQYLYSSGKKSLLRGVNERSQASIITSTIMAAASLVFLGASFHPPRTLGWLLCVGILMSLVGDLWILVGLSHKTKEGH